MTVKGIIAQNLLQERTKHGLTQEGLAYAIGMSPCYLRRIEHGTANPVSYTHLDVYNRQCLSSYP